MLRVGSGYFEGLPKGNVGMGRYLVAPLILSTHLEQKVYLPGQRFAETTCEDRSISGLSEPGEQSIYESNQDVTNDCRIQSYCSLQIRTLDLHCHLFLLPAKLCPVYLGQGASR